MILEGNQIFRFGGHTKSDCGKHIQTVDANVYILQIDKFVWTILNFIGPSPEPRSLHCMVMKEYPKPKYIQGFLWTK